MKKDNIKLDPVKSVLKKAEPQIENAYVVTKQDKGTSNKRLAGAITSVGLISYKCYPCRARHSVMHRGRWSQTNGWALRHHSSSTFFASHTLSIVLSTHFHPLWCSAVIAMHVWLTGIVATTNQS
jgi:hypothetical protein